MTSTRHSGRSPMSMVSCLSRECSDQSQGIYFPRHGRVSPAHPRLTSFAQITPVMAGFVPGIHVFFVPRLMQDVDGRDKPGHDGNLECRPACFPALLAPNKGREISGG